MADFKTTRDANGYGLAVQEIRALDLTALGSTSVSVAFVTHVRVSGHGGMWASGPLPILQPVNSTTERRDDSRPTDAAARSSLVAQQQADVLYGNRDLSRWHRIVEDCEPLLALELLADVTDEHGGWGFLVVHAKALSQDAGEWLDRVVHGRESSFWDSVRRTAGPSVVIADRPQARTVVFLDIGRDGPTASVLPSAYALASARSLQDTDVVNRSSQHTLTISKRDWSALVLRDGAAFVAHQRSIEPFSPTLRMLVHSVHVDALLLALVQRRMVDRSGDRAANASLAGASELLDLEREHFEFKRTYWRTSLTSKRTAPVDQVLRAFQDQLLTALDVADVEERVADGARLAVSLTSSAQQAAQERLNRLVQRTSVVLGSLGLMLTAVPIVNDSGWAVFLVAVGLAVLGIAGAFVVLHLVRSRSE